MSDQAARARVQLELKFDVWWCSNNFNLTDYPKQFDDVKHISHHAWQAALALREEGSGSRDESEPSTASHSHDVGDGISLPEQFGQYDKLRAERESEAYKLGKKFGAETAFALREEALELAARRIAKMNRAVVDYETVLEILREELS